MINYLNTLKANKENLNFLIPVGGFFLTFSFIDIFTNTFFHFNLTGFLPNIISYFSPLVIGVIGLYLIRIEFSGIRLLDKLNKNLNSSSFNAVLTLLTPQKKSD